MKMDPLVQILAACREGVWKLRGRTYIRSTVYLHLPTKRYFEITNTRLGTDYQWCYLKPVVMEVKRVVEHVTWRLINLHGG